MKHLIQAVGAAALAIAAIAPATASPYPEARYDRRSFPPGARPTWSPVLWVPAGELARAAVCRRKPAWRHWSDRRYTRQARAPDGYTLLVASIGVYATNPFLQKGLQYDPAKDFDC
jgi:hypothetical protein